MDLTNYFLVASAKTKIWSLNKMFKLLYKFIEPNSSFRLCWEISNLEQWSVFFEIPIDWNLTQMDKRPWLSIKENSEVVGYVRTDMPLMILIRTYSSVFLVEPEMTTILADRFDEKMFSFDLSKESNICSNLDKKSFWNRRANMINSNSFSIFELWWATIIPPEMTEIKHDLTSYLISSYHLKKEWSHQKIHIILNLIRQNIINSCVLWDDSNGERWVEMRLDNNPICFISFDIPFLFILSNYTEIIKHLLSCQDQLGSEVNCVEVEDFSANTLVLDKKRIAKMFPRVDFNFFPDFFSVEDFVFLTMFVVL